MENEKRLIDANALKLKAWPESETGEGIVYVEDIDDAPTVDAVEVVHGWWDYTPDHAEYCTVCGFYPDEEENHEYNYCPNCGAKMNGEGKDNGNL